MWVVLKYQKDAGPLLSLAAILLLGCSLLSVVRKFYQGGRKSVGPADDIKSESQLLAQAELDQVARQKIEVSLCRLSC